MMENAVAEWRPMPGKRFYVIYNRLNSFSPWRDSILQPFNLLNRWSVSLLRLPPLPLSPSCRTLCTPRDDTFLFNLNSCSQIMQQIFFSAFRCVLEDFLCLFHTWEKITSSDEQESRVEWFVIELRGTLVRLFALRSAEVFEIWSTLLGTNFTSSRLPRFVLFFLLLDLRRQTDSQLVKRTFSRRNRL